ncbi:MAG: hypothetical protein KatS3mg129_0365 [Leptospiraceae bacterium]|nr:MAG: hypothetical protein KatS3mg129_0365 [Leptospiraceae bacterium]
MNLITQLPVPVGVLYKTNRPIFEEEYEKLIEKNRQIKGEPDLQKILYSGEIWEIKAD